MSMHRFRPATLLGAGALLVFPTMAVAQGINIESYLPSTDPSVAGRIVQLMVLITVLSVAPGLLMMVTSFTRFVMALSFLRAGLGLQTTPSNLVLVSLALFLTMFVMAPTFDEAWRTGVKPLVDNQITPEEGYNRTTAPFRTFMKTNVRDKDLATFRAMAEQRTGSAGTAGRRRFPNPYPGVHGFRASSRLRDRLPDRASFHRHRFGCRYSPDVHGHDDDAANRHLAAAQGLVLRDDRWLDPAGRGVGQVIYPIAVRRGAICK